MEKLTANLFVFGAFATLGTVSIVTAFYLPPLGILSCITLLAYFSDYNKKTFNKYIPPLNEFFNNEELVSLDHQLLLGIVAIAVIANFIGIVVRSTEAFVY